MPRFKPGDRVRVKTTLIGDHSYGAGGLYFTEEMEEYCGRIFTISKISNERLSRYHLEGVTDSSGRAWVFNDDMLEPAAEQKIYEADIESIMSNSENFFNLLGGK